jgi:putative FmdB family regulatory protein
MPTYEYACRACNHRFELFQSIKAPVKRKCPACGASRLERLIGAGAGIIFKGAGFYQTDYRSDSYKKAADAESKAASGGDDSSKAPKAEGKPEKPTEAKPSGGGAEAKPAAPRPARRGGKAPSRRRSG